MNKPHNDMMTRRLRLRRWRNADREPFADLNADPRVCAFLPSTLSAEQSNAMADRINTHFDHHGYGLWAVELQEDAAFIGYVGLQIPAFEAHFTPCVEIGWRLAARYWNSGYATEAALCVLDHAFETLKLPEVVSFTVPDNMASRRVMEKIGMKHDASENFDHPKLPEGDRLSRHVLYRITR